MFAIVEPRRVDDDTKASLEREIPARSLSSKKNVVRNHYKINYVFDGETTLLLFARNKVTHQRVVMKILKKYQDIRYHMATVEERQKCQVEALKQSRRFSPDVYIGLARLYSLDLKKKELLLGEIVKEPDNISLETNEEYVLVMQWLPKDRRLNYLLNTSDTSVQVQCADILSECIARIHNRDLWEHTVSPPESDWGSCAQLQQKLKHNFIFFDQVRSVAKDSSGDFYTRVNTLLSQMEKALSAVFRQEYFRHCFDRRLLGGFILHCHGDLKASNIWILSSETHNAHIGRERVKILDAVDFNSSYSNIDVLCDMAMLAIDLEVRTSSKVAKRFISHYLHATRQKNRVAEGVLAYYLAERAMIGAIVSIGYDRQFDVGEQYLQVAEKRLRELKRHARVRRGFSSCVNMLKNVVLFHSRGSKKQGLEEKSILDESNAQTVNGQPAFIL